MDNKSYTEQRITFLRLARWTNEKRPGGIPCLNDALIAFNKLLLTGGLVVIRNYTLKISIIAHGATKTLSSLLRVLDQSDYCIKAGKAAT